MTSEQSDALDAGGTTSGVSVSAIEEAGAGPGTASHSARARAEWRRARNGLWRVAVEEESMAPALHRGDWLLLDPTVARWPRRGSIVVFHEPDGDLLAIKRLAAGPGDRVRLAAGVLHLGPDEAWLLGDNLTVSIDSRRYGPVDLDGLIARAWFRYAPASRIGPIPR